MNNRSISDLFTFKDFKVNLLENYKRTRLMEKHRKAAVFVSKVKRTLTRITVRKKKRGKL